MTAPENKPARDGNVPVEAAPVGSSLTAPAEYPPASRAGRGLFGVHGTGDTSGFGGLVRRKRRLQRRRRLSGHRCRRGRVRSYRLRNARPDHNVKRNRQAFNGLQRAHTRALPPHAKYISRRKHPLIREIRLLIERGPARARTHTSLLRTAHASARPAI